MKLLKINHVKYGLIMVTIPTICLLIMELTGQNQTFDNKSPFQLIFMFVAPLVVWTLGIRAKKKALKNKLSFKQGLSEGFKISLVYAAVSPFMFMAYYLFVNPEIINYVRSAYRITGATNNMVILVDMVVQFVTATLFGTIYSAIISFFLKSK